MINLCSRKHSAAALCFKSPANYSTKEKGKRKMCHAWTYPADPEQRGLGRLRRAHCLEEEEQMLGKVRWRGRCGELLPLSAHAGIPGRAPLFSPPRSQGMARNILFAAKLSCVPRSHPQ